MSCYGWRARRGLNDESEGVAAPLALATFVYEEKKINSEECPIQCSMPRSISADNLPLFAELELQSGALRHTTSLASILSGFRRSRRVACFSEMSTAASKSSLANKPNAMMAAFQGIKSPAPDSGHNHCSSFEDTMINPEECPIKCLMPRSSSADSLASLAKSQSGALRRTAPLHNISSGFRAATPSEILSRTSSLASASNKRDSEPKTPGPMMAVFQDVKIPAPDSDHNHCASYKDTTINPGERIIKCSMPRSSSADNLIVTAFAKPQSDALRRTASLDNIQGSSGFRAVASSDFQSRTSSVETSKRDSGPETPGPMMAAFQGAKIHALSQCQSADTLVPSTLPLSVALNYETASQLPTVPGFSAYGEPTQDDKEGEQSVCSTPVCVAESC